jgi:hypothetical protein
LTALKTKYQELEGKMELKDHKVGKLNSAINIQVQDESDLSGMHYSYGFYISIQRNTQKFAEVKFQKGPPKKIAMADQAAEIVPEGLTEEALLAVLIHRLRCKVKMPINLKENSVVLQKLEESLMWLNHIAQD